MGSKRSLIRWSVLESGQWSSRKWKEELIVSTFPEDIAAKILHIPLTKEAHDDILAWSGGPSGEFTGIETDPRAYALQTDYRKFYKKLWVLNLPSKIKFTIWRISWNYIPTRVNMHIWKLSNNRICPGCVKEAETNNHLFRECPVTKTVWKRTKFFRNTKSTVDGVHSVAYMDVRTKNKQVHEKISRSGKEKSNFIKSYISELKGIEEKLPKDLTEVKSWQHLSGQTVKINFDTAYNEKICQAVVGIVARNREGSVLLSLSMIHPQVESTFAAEAIACRTTTQLGIDMKWSDLIIEGDALTIIQKCNTRNEDKSNIEAYIHDIQRIRAKIKSCRLKMEERQREKEYGRLGGEKIIRFENGNMKMGIVRLESGLSK
ncbi:Zinc finger, CCHC-type [Gossypium australe]|uniref:Zinc finger, CCHC-type n=1 Tax=Gossypium australe TaxID=47621 RepID=A0A5B6VW79_9ROSI|nr:Zinc finger, CCHC-type [Gossypium australe]